LYCILVLCATSVFADDGFYVTGSLGQSRFDPGVPDGTWHNQALGYQFTKQDLAYKAGLGYSMNHWNVELNYIHFGSVKMFGGTVDDRGYDPVNHTVLPGWQTGFFEGKG